MGNKLYIVIDNKKVEPIMVYPILGDAKKFILENSSEDYSINVVDSGIIDGSHGIVGEEDEFPEFPTPMENDIDYSYDDLIKLQVRYDRERVNLYVILDLIKHRERFEPYYESVNEIKRILLEKIAIAERKMEECANKIKNFNKKSL